MTTRWERLAGDTGVFALKLAFSSDPDEGRGIDPETGASWGSFQIWARGRNLCAHREEGEGIESVHWYMLPLLEWFASNWDPLLHEERPPIDNKGDTAWESLRETRFPPAAIEDDEHKASEWEGTWQAWRSRHALLTAREGGLFPDIVFRRLRDKIELSWGPAAVAGIPAHYRFTDSETGVDYFSPLSVAEPLHDVLLQAGSHLSALMPESKRIRTLNRNLRGLNPAGKADGAARERRRLAWLAGLGTTSHGVLAGWRQATESLSGLDEQPRRAWLKSMKTPLVVTGSCHAALMFGSLAPDVTVKDVQKLARAATDLYSPQGNSEKMCTAFGAAPVAESVSRPWDQGYDLAEDVHERVDGDFEKDGFVDVELLVRTLGGFIGNLALSDKHVRGVAIVGPQHKPGIFVNENNVFNAREAGRRFTLAHELCHLLFDRERGQALAVASGPWAPHAIEQRANAFAAMLLMPKSLLKRTLADLTSAVATKGGVIEVAERLRVCRRSALLHLANLGFVDDPERQRLEGELSPLA